MGQFDGFEDFNLHPEDFDGLDFSDTSASMREKAMQVLLSDEKFNKFVEKINRIILDGLKEQTATGLEPIMFILTLTKQLKMGVSMVPIPSMGSDHEERREIFAAIGRAFAQADIGIPLAVYTGTEAWVVKTPGYDWEKEGLPSQHPDRQQVITGTCTSIDGRTAMSLSDLDRGPNNEMLVTHTEITYYERGGDNKTQDNLTPSFFAGFGGKVFSSFLKDLSQKQPEKTVIDNNIADQLLKSWD